MAEGVLWEQIRWEMEMKMHLLKNKEEVIKPIHAFITF